MANVKQVITSQEQSNVARGIAKIIRDLKQGRKPYFKDVIDGLLRQQSRAGGSQVRQFLERAESYVGEAESAFQNAANGNLSSHDFRQMIQRLETAATVYSKARRLIRQRQRGKSLNTAQKEAHVLKSVKRYRVKGGIQKSQVFRLFKGFGYTLPPRTTKITIMGDDIVVAFPTDEDTARRHAADLVSELEGQGYRDVQSKVRNGPTRDLKIIQLYFDVSSGAI